MISTPPPIASVSAPSNSPICFAPPYQVGDPLPSSGDESVFVYSYAVVRSLDNDNRPGAWLIQDSVGGRWVVGSNFMPPELYARIGRPAMSVIFKNVEGERTSLLIRVSNAFRVKGAVACVTRS